MTNFVRLGHATWIGTSIKAHLFLKMINARDDFTVYCSAEMEEGASVGSATPARGKHSGRAGEEKKRKGKGKSGVFWDGVDRTLLIEQFPYRVRGMGIWGTAKSPGGWAASSSIRRQVRPSRTLRTTKLLMEQLLYTRKGMELCDTPKSSRRMGSNIKYKRKENPRYIVLPKQTLY